VKFADKNHHLCDLHYPASRKTMKTTCLKATPHFV
jgi:hypothetical protein